MCKPQATFVIAGVIFYFIVRTSVLTRKANRKMNVLLGDIVRSYPNSSSWNEACCCLFIRLFIYYFSAVRRALNFMRLYFLKLSYNFNTELLVQTLTLTYSCYWSKCWETVSWIHSWSISCGFSRISIGRVSTFLSSTFIRRLWRSLAKVDAFYVLISPFTLLHCSKSCG